jgi:outer membrane protein
MKTTKLLFLLVAMNLVAAPAVQAEDFEVKTVAVVNVKRIIDESTAAKTAKEQIEKLKTKYMAEIKEQEKKLQARGKELVEQKKALSAEAWGKKSQEFNEKVKGESKEAQKKQKVVEAALVKSLEVIRDETIKVVAEIAKEKKIDLVIPNSQLLFSKSGLDISDEVLKKLNERLTKVDINVKQ